MVRTSKRTIGFLKFSCSIAVTLRYTLGYTLLFSLTAWVNHYESWLRLPPASIHQWRQADGAALAWHYGENPDFSEALLCNLFYTGNAHALGELPLFYWLSGLMSHYWGYPAYPLRWIGLLLLFAGCWAFGWTILQLTKRALPAILGSGLLLSSPVLMYYGPGFLPDAPAFCFILMMIACLFRADQRQSMRWLCAAAVCTALAILLKLSLAILPLALVMAWAWGRYRGRWLAAPFWGGPGPVFATVTAVIIVAGFRWWIAQYNTLHQAGYFLTTTRPVWHYDLSFIRETLAHIASFGVPAFASAGLYLACTASLFLSLKHWKTTPWVFQKIILFTILGSAVYVLLWFRMLREHDYYFICLLVVPAVLLLNGFRLAMSRFAEKHLVFVLGIFMMLSWGHSYYMLTRRLYLAFHPQTSQNLPPDAFLPAGHLSEGGIPLSARVLCPQDPSPNIGLLALQRYGWTAYNFGDRITADTLKKYQTNFGLTHLALRDTALYNPLYRRFFPVETCQTRGWYLYAR